MVQYILSFVVTTHCMYGHASQRDSKGSCSNKCTIVRLHVAVISFFLWNVYQYSLTKNSSLRESSFFSALVHSMHSKNSFFNIFSCSHALWKRAVPVWPPKAFFPFFSPWNIEIVFRGCWLGVHLSVFIEWDSLLWDCVRRKWSTPSSPPPHSEDLSVKLVPTVNEGQLHSEFISEYQPFPNVLIHKLGNTISPFGEKVKLVFLPCLKLNPHATFAIFFRIYGNTTELSWYK